MEVDSQARAEGAPHPVLTEFVCDFLLLRYGLRKIAELHMAETRMRVLLGCSGAIAMPRLWIHGQKWTPCSLSMRFEV